MTGLGSQEHSHTPAAPVLLSLVRGTDTKQSETQQYHITARDIQGVLGTSWQALEQTVLFSKQFMIEDGMSQQEADRHFKTTETSVKEGLALPDYHLSLAASIFVLSRFTYPEGQEPTDKFKEIQHEIVKLVTAIEQNPEAQREIQESKRQQQERNK